MDFPFFTPIDEQLFRSRIVQVSGSVGSKMAHNINRQLLALEREAPDQPIYLYINSPGGEVSSGFSIYDTARFIRPSVVTLVIGMAASMGSIIALCAERKNRLALPNAKFLIHQPLISGHLTGPASDIDIHAKDIIRTKRKINELYALETKRPLEEIEKATDRDNWMNAKEAIDFGLISRIVASRNEL
ncbi:MAG: ATP-dependent Clp protease proteolytic subunit [Myxococcales bacterium]|nr:ATP-dependent Clp protease proteolytic subunit [Myxococcales bacterium]